MRCPLDNFIPDRSRPGSRPPLVLLSSRVPVETMLLMEKKTEDKEEKQGGVSKG